MSDCKCKSPCNPCNDNCPDDGEILDVELLDADECGGGCWNSCCPTKCNDNCWINIQSTNECLEVDTSECWVVKITSHCPPIVTAWDNVRVDVEDCWQPNCSLNYIVSADCPDEKVKACSGDSTPGTLIEKLQKWPWIKIDSVGCDWTNSKVKISIDEDYLPDCPTIPDVVVHDGSDLINAYAIWHDVYISDADAKHYYAKLVLSEDSDWIKTMNTGAEDRFALFWDASTASRTTVYNKNLVIEKWYIKVTKTWLYHVWFSGSAECWSWVHAFRVQLWSSAGEAASSTKTLIESRYSAPIWDQPFEVNGFPGPHYVTDVDSDWDPIYWQQFRIDNPLRWPATDVEWTQREAQWKSASLWSYISRMPVWWSTIVELKKWDTVWIWVKISAKVFYNWDILWRMDDYTSHFALLCKNSRRSWGEDTGPECWLSFFVDMIHPILWQNN